MPQVIEQSLFLFLYSTICGSLVRNERPSTKRFWPLALFDAVAYFDVVGELARFRRPAAWKNYLF